MEDRNTEVQRFRQAAQAAPESDASRAEHLLDGASYFRNRYLATYDEADIEEAISLFKEAIGILPKEHPSRPSSLVGLGNCLGLKADRSNAMEDIQEAIRAAKEALDSTPPGHKYHAMALHNVGTSLSVRYVKTKTLADLDEVILFRRLAVDAASGENPARSNFLAGFLRFLQIRFSETGNQADILEFLYRQGASNNDVVQDPFGTMFERLLGGVSSTEDGEALDHSIDHFTTVVQAMSQDDTRFSSTTYRLGMLLSVRHEETKSGDDLDSAIANLELADCLTSVEHPEYSRILSSVGVLLTERADEGRGDLVRAFDALARASAVAPDLNASLGACWARLGAKLQKNYEATDTMADLNTAIDAMSRAVRTTPANHVRHMGFSTDLALMLYTRYEIAKSVDDLDRGIEVTKHAVQVSNPNKPGYAKGLRQLGIFYRLRLSRSEAASDLDSAIKVFATAVEIEPPGSPQRTISLDYLLDLLKKRLKISSHPEDLDHAIDVANDLVEITMPEDSELVHRLCQLGDLYRRRFETDGSLEDLKHSFAAFTRGMESQPKQTPLHTKILQDMAVLYSYRYKAAGRRDDLHCATDVAKALVAATPFDHPKRAERLNMLGTFYKRKFEDISPSSREDLDLAIEYTGQSIEAAPPGHPELAGLLTNHASALARRFHAGEVMDDINAAVDFASQAVDASPKPEGAKNREKYGIMLSNLSTMFMTRYRSANSEDDLHAAIETATKALPLIPESPKGGYTDRSIVFSTFGMALGQKFGSTGSSADLNQAIDASTRAAHAALPDQPSRPTLLANLSSWLQVRFHRTGSTDDLNRSIELATAGLDITPKDSPGYSNLQNRLARSLRMRFERFRAVVDINYAIELLEQAVKAPPTGNYLYRADLMDNLATCLKCRSHGDDLDRGISLMTEALDLTPLEHHSRGGLIFTLSDLFYARYKSTRRKRSDTSPPTTDADLDKSIELMDSITQGDPNEREYRAVELFSHGLLLWERHQMSASDDDRDLALSSYQRGLACRNIYPTLRISFLQNIADILASLGQWKEASGHLREAIQVLPMVSPRFLKHVDKQARLVFGSGLATSAAAAALQAKTMEPPDVLQLLELGRGFIAGTLVDIRTDVSDLKAACPDLADKFTLLRSELDLPIEKTTMDLDPKADDVLSWETRERRRQELDQEFDELVRTIRAHPGFSDFLCPPSTEELIKAADPDPIIVINTSPYRCDAWLITQTGISMIPLPDLRLEDIKSHARYLNSRSVHSDLLQWLWDSTCSPCLGALGFTKAYRDDDKWPRVWWVPTGILASFPLHAAQSFRPGEIDASVLDRVISSYASSVKALLHGRRRRLASPNQNPDQDAPGSILLVAMPKTPSPSSDPIKDLPYAQEEIDMVEGLAEDLELNLAKPTRAHRIEVLAEMQRCQIFHFAGHGRSHRDPSQSSLLLEDWQTDELTVGHVFASRLPENRQDKHHFLAYLSACSTASNRDEKLSDEGIHLVSAFQLAGFRHVIGTLWEVSDNHCVGVAGDLYKTLKLHKMTDRAVCLGLHMAVKALRDRCRNQASGEPGRDASWSSVSAGGNASWSRVTAGGDMSWVPYIHFGV